MFSRQTVFILYSLNRVALYFIKPLPVRINLNDTSRLYGKARQRLSDTREMPDARQAALFVHPGE